LLGRRDRRPARRGLLRRVGLSCLAARGRNRCANSAVAAPLDRPGSFEAEPLDTGDDDDDGGADSKPAAPDEALGVDFAEDDDLEDADDDEVPFIEDDEDDFSEDEIDGLPDEGSSDE